MRGSYYYRLKKIRLYNSSYICFLRVCFLYFAFLHIYILHIISIGLFLLWIFNKQANPPDFRYSKTWGEQNFSCLKQDLIRLGKWEELKGLERWDFLFFFFFPLLVKNKWSSLLKLPLWHWLTDCVVVRWLYFKAKNEAPQESRGIRFVYVLTQGLQFNIYHIISHGWFSRCACMLKINDCKKAFCCCLY